MSILKYPFIKLALALMAGRLLLSVFTELAVLYWLVAALFLLLLLLLFRVCLRKHLWLWRRFSLWIFLASMALLYAAYVLHLEKLPSLSEQESSYCAVLLSPPVEKPKSYQCELQEMTKTSGFAILRPKSKWQLYIAKDSASAALRTGDVLYFRCRLEDLAEPALMDAYPDSLLAAAQRRPQAFDYHHFLRRKGFVATAYVPAGQWGKDENRRYLLLRRQAEQLRHRCVQRYENAGIEGEALALIAALTLGEKSQFEDQARNRYSSIGVSHILAVSGMHVGIICQLISLFIGGLPRSNRWLLWLRQCLLIAMLWAYALLTGMSASVLRAVLMYTVAALAICLQRKAYTWNSLAFAACVMLLWQPAYFYNLGFQLSFVAVASILLWQPYFQQAFALSADSPLQSMMTASSVMMNVQVQSKALHSFVQRLARFLRKLFDYFKELFCLSLAAQIGTAPLSVYYFHQFSNVFWLSNLLMVPLALPLTYLGIALLCLSDLPLIGPLLSTLLEAALRLFICVSKGLSALPFSSTQHLYPSSAEISLLYVLLFSLFFLLRSNKLHYFIDQFFRRRRKVIWKLQ
nr:ComEC/Rec2 family competence protein [Bacteroidales bacterium]